MSAHHNKEHVAQWAAILADATPEAVLRWAAATFPGRIALATSLGIEDQVLTSMIANEGLPIRIFSLDTGRLFPETYDLLARTTVETGIPIEVFCPAAEEVEEMVRLHGANLFRDSVAERKRCCDVRKVRPLRRAQVGLDAWVCGLRCGQGVTRDGIAVVEWDEAAGLVKINPLATWGEDEVWAYARANDVPYSPLHDAGFPSIGCAPCTRAVAPGDDPRSGRWWWEDALHRECGLHSRAGAVGGNATAAVSPSSATAKAGCALPPTTSGSGPALGCQDGGEAE